MRRLQLQLQLQRLTSLPPPPRAHTRRWDGRRRCRTAGAVGAPERYIVGERIGAGTFGAVLRP